MKTNRQIIALGFFDGVHLGHRALLKACADIAAEQNALTAAITFNHHPQLLFAVTPPLINNLADRQWLLRRFGVEKIRTIPVTEEVMSTDWRDFLEQLIRDGAVGFVCGNDFRFGHRGEGDGQKLAQFCRERDLPCRIVEEQCCHGIRVSSTRIRRLIEQGRMAEAVELMGHPHILSGTVTAGQKLGRTIGVPTANLRLPDGVVVPRFGVYVCKAILENGEFMAVTNVGTRPTVEGYDVTVEPWLLDFSGDLYGKKLTLEFYEFLRPEQKFPSLEALREEIQRNALQTREFFEKN